MSRYHTAKKKEPTELEYCQDDVLIEVKKGPHLFNELENIFCIARKGSARRGYTKDVFLLAVSKMLEDGRLIDHDGLLILPRPKQYESEYGTPADTL